LNKTDQPQMTQMTRPQVKAVSYEPQIKRMTQILCG